MKYIAYSSASPSGLVQKAVGAVVAVAIAATLLVFSSVFLAVLAVAAVIGGIWLWWKTRHVRRMMREMHNQMSRAREAFESGGGFRQGPFAGPNASGVSEQYSREERHEGVIIEGEAVRVDERR